MMLYRYPHRFGGSGTIVSLANGWAFTAAHCLAPVDGAPGVVIASRKEAGGARPTTHWRVVQRWSPAGSDLVVLQTLPARSAPDGPRTRHAAVTLQPLERADRTSVRLGGEVTFIGHAARGFQARRARVIAVTSTSATAQVEHRRGVCASDSGGPVLIDGVLVGIVTHRTGEGRSPTCSSQVVFTRLDSPVMRRRLRALVPLVSGVPPSCDHGLG